MKIRNKYIIISKLMNRFFKRYKPKRGYQLGIKPIKANIRPLFKSEQLISVDHLLSSRPIKLFFCECIFLLVLDL